MYKNQNERIEILLTCVYSFSFHANHLFIQGCNQKNQIKPIQLSIEELCTDNYSNSASKPKIQGYVGT